MRALRSLPIAGAHQDFAVAFALPAVKFVNRHGSRIISSILALNPLLCGPRPLRGMVPQNVPTDGSARGNWSQETRDAIFPRISLAEHNLAWLDRLGLRQRQGQHTLIHAG
jgi:hypothetical protein